MPKPQLRVIVECAECQEILQEIGEDGAAAPEGFLQKQGPVIEHECGFFSGKYKVEMPALKIPLQTEQSGE